MLSYEFIPDPKNLGTKAWLFFLCMDIHTLTVYKYYFT